MVCVGLKPTARLHTAGVVGEEEAPKTEPKPRERMSLLIRVVVSMGQCNTRSKSSRSRDQLIQGIARLLFGLSEVTGSGMSQLVLGAFHLHV